MVGAVDGKSVGVRVGTAEGKSADDGGHGSSDGDNDVVGSRVVGLKEIVGSRVVGF